MQTLVTLFNFAGLMVLPGAWIVCTLLSPQLSWSARVALSTVLSPLVLALEVVFLKWCGVGFAAAVVVAQWTALSGLVPLVLRILRSARGRIDGKSAGCLAAAIVILVGIVLAPEIRDPAYGVYGRHALMHAEICYQLDQRAAQPEEPQLAGVPLAYPWLFHIHWAVLGQAARLPPTTVDTWTNLVYLAGFCIFFWETVRLLGAGRTSALLGLWLVTLGTNVLGRPAHLVQVMLGMESGGFLTGDPRYSPLLVKFAASNQMPLALTLIGALMLLGVRSVLWPHHRAAVLMGFTLASVGLMYPPVFPPAAAAIGALVLFKMWPLARTQDSPSGERWLFGLALVVAVCAVGLYGQTLLAGRSRATMRVAGLGDMLKQSALVVLVLGPLAVPVFWAGAHRDRLRQGLCVWLALAAAVSIVLNVALRMAVGLEYKFMLCSAMFLGPLTALGIDAWLRNRRRLGTVLAVLMPLALIPMSMQTLLRFVPAELKRAPKIANANSAYYLSLHETEPHAGWTRAIREKTPVETVVVSRTYHAYVPAFAARAVYVSGEAEGGIPGYGMSCADNMVRNRGYCGDEYQGRLDALADLFGAAGEERWEKALTRIRSLARPVAFVLERGPDQALAAWLSAQAPMSLLWQDDHYLVFQLPFP